MSLVVNLRHLAKEDVFLKGELPVSEMDIETRDKMIRLDTPLRYDLEAQQLKDGLLIRGRLELTLDCQCVRCLKQFQFPLELEDWACLLPLQGEERVPVVNDCVDLTPHIREDILLEFPRHPLCKPDCRGLAQKNIGKVKTSDAGRIETASSAWAELDKLKLKNLKES